MSDDAAIDRIVREAAVLWNAHKFFECHDKLEEAWRLVKHEKKAEPAKDPRRDLIHGIILYAAAYVHWQKGNLLGVSRKREHARQALGKTALRRLAGVDATSWLAAVDIHVARGAAGEPLRAASVPPWPR